MLATLEGKAWLIKMDDEYNERAQATAVVSYLNQQLAYQLACRQETRYQEILAEESALEESLTNSQTEEVISCDQTAREAANEVSEAERSGSFSPYITPPESPSKLSFSSPFTTKETRTIACETVPPSTSAAVTQTDGPLYHEMINEGCQSVPLTLEVAVGTPPICVEDKSASTELSAFELLQVVHNAENSQRIHEEHKLAMRELNEEKSKRLVSEQLVNIVQSDLMAARQQNISETTARLRLEKEVADLKVHTYMYRYCHCNLYVVDRVRLLREEAA